MSQDSSVFLTVRKYFGSASRPISRHRRTSKAGVSYKRAYSIQARLLQVKAADSITSALYASVSMESNAGFWPWHIACEWAPYPLSNCAENGAQLKFLQVSFALLSPL